jgi:hypothetical protein
MDIRKTAIGLLLAVAAAACAVNPALARTYVDITIAPPPPRVEPLPPPRAGYVWVPGVWAWNGHRHVWHRGHWIGERYGYSYVPPRWTRHGERWRYDDGRWERGRDHSRDRRHDGERWDRRHDGERWDRRHDGERWDRRYDDGRRDRHRR